MAEKKAVPYFSVVIPTLNEEKYLPRLFDDLEKQVFTDFEVIVADGSSQDKTVEESKKRRSFKAQTFVREKKNVASQRNYGAKKSRGKYVLFSDADNRIGPSFLSDVYAQISQSKYLLLVPSMTNHHCRPHEKIYLEFANLYVELSQYSNRPFASGGTFIVEKSLFFHLGGFDETLFIAEDHEFIQRAYKAGVHAKFLVDVSYEFSLRRLKHEGTLSLLSKYGLGTYFSITQGGMKKKMFQYEMGGGSYNDVDYKKKIGKLQSLYNKVYKIVSDRITSQ